MSLDLRPLLTNATAEVLEEILEDHALRAEILWAFIVLLHFAALLPLLLCCATGESFNGRMSGE